MVDHLLRYKESGVLIQWEILLRNLRPLKMTWNDTVNTYAISLITYSMFAHTRSQ